MSALPGLGESNRQFVNREIVSRQSSVVNRERQSQVEIRQFINSSILSTVLSNKAKLVVPHRFEPGFKD